MTTTEMGMDVRDDLWLTDYQLQDIKQRIDTIQRNLAFEKQRLDNIERADSLMRFRRKMRQAHGAAY